MECTKLQRYYRWAHRYYRWPPVATGIDFLNYRPLPLSLWNWTRRINIATGTTAGVPPVLPAPRGPTTPADKSTSPPTLQPVNPRHRYYRRLHRYYRYLAACVQVRAMSPCILSTYLPLCTWPIYRAPSPLVNLRQSMRMN